MARRQDLTATDLKQVVLFAALVYLAIRFLNAIAGIVLLFSLIALITLVLNPAVGWLERYKIPRQLSAGILALMVLGAITTAAWLIIPPAAAQLGELVEDLPRHLAVAQNWLAARAGAVGIEVTSIEPTEMLEFLTQRAGPILSRIGTYTLGAFSFVASLFVLFISVIYTLAKPRPLVEGFLRLFEPAQGEKVASALQRLASELRMWAIATMIGMLGVFLMTWFALGVILDVPFAFLFAVIAGLLEIVPVIGPIAAAVPPVLVALTLDPVLGLWVIIAFIIIQQVESYVLFPLLMAGGLELHPVSVIFSVMVMGGLFGIVGIFLAVPAAVSARVIVDEFYVRRREGGGRKLSERVEGIISGEGAGSQ